MTMIAGAANVVITPSVGVEIAGYGFGPSLGILNDLEAQALYLKQGDEQIVIATADLLTFGSELVTRVRRRVEATFGISAERISFSPGSCPRQFTSLLREACGLTEPVDNGRRGGQQ